MDLTEMVDQKCYIETADGDKFEGTVQAASVMGVLVKPKGTSTPRLIEMDQLISCEPVPAEPSTLRQKRLDPLPVAKTRRHLMDSHGWSLSVVNKMTEDDAVHAHDSADHSDLGHNHSGRKKSEGNEATETEGDE